MASGRQEGFNEYDSCYSILGIIEVMRMGNKYEKEIEEIINRKGEFLMDDHLKTSGQSSRNSNRYSITAFVSYSIKFLLNNRSRMLLASLSILLICSLLLGSTIPAIGTFLISAVIILFLGSYFLSFAKLSGRNRQKRWRGELVGSPKQNIQIGRLLTLLRRIRFLR